jgi:hypothetical protein
MKFQLVEISFFPQEVEFHNSMCFDLSQKWTFGVSLMLDSYHNENMLNYLEEKPIFQEQLPQL